MPDLFRRSRSARAIVGILKAVASAGLGGMTSRGLCHVLASRYSGSTVSHTLTWLRRLGLVQRCGRGKQRVYAVVEKSGDRLIDTEIEI